MNVCEESVLLHSNNLLIKAVVDLACCRFVCKNLNCLTNSNLRIELLSYLWWCLKLKGFSISTSTFLNTASIYCFAWVFESLLLKMTQSYSIRELLLASFSLIELVLRLFLHFLSSFRGMLFGVDRRLLLFCYVWVVFKKITDLSIVPEVSTPCSALQKITAIVCFFLCCARNSFFFFFVDVSGVSMEPLLPLYYLISLSMII